MKALGLLALLASLAAPTRADFKASGDTQVTGQVGVGTSLPRAQFHVQMSSMDNYALQITSPSGAVLLQVDKAGKLGIGVANPQANIDVAGQGDSGGVGLELRSGNSTSTFLSSQIIFASTAGAYAHSLRTRAVASQDQINSIDFFLWNSTAQPYALGSLDVLSLTVSTGSTGSVHVMPVSSAPTAELEVSDGNSLGGGTMEYYQSGPPGSSREIKSDIQYYVPEKAAQALEDIKSLRHARYRYKKFLPGPSLNEPILVDNPSAPLRRGLIYEDAPASIQGPHKEIVVDYRVMNLELALQEVDRRIQKLEAQIAALRKLKKGLRGKR